MRTLRTLVWLARKFRYVPIYVLASNLKLKSSITRRILEYLVELELVDIRKTKYEGYAITQKGFDILALRLLLKRINIERITARLDVGKEADIHLCETLENGRYIIKVFRLGRTSFKKVRTVRPGYETTGGWISINIKAATREYWVLQRLWEKGVAVPRPVTKALHMIVMEYVPGVELSKVRVDNPIAVFRSIISEIIKAYYKARIVHADLSEYNILIDLNTNEIWIIDWPQWLSRLHPEAPSFLEKDLNQIVFYFRRKYKLNIDDLWAIIEEIREEYALESKAESLGDILGKSEE